MKPNSYAQKVYDFTENQSGNAVISAVAGSGKTTLLLGLLKTIPTNKSVLFLAFNKSIAKELQERVPQTNNITVRTVHSFGFSSINKAEIFSGKYSKMLREIMDFLSEKPVSLKPYGFTKQDMDIVYSMQDKDRFIEQYEGEKKDKVDINSQEYIKKVLQLCDLGRLNLVSLNNMDKGLEQLAQIAEKHNIIILNGECYRAWCLIKLGTSYRAKIDFTDMVYYPNIFNVPVKQYDFVFIDECQDLNTCQRELMVKAIKPNTGRFIAVGDEKQAIYGFAGADSDSFKRLKSIANTTEFPLSVCYRCGIDIIKIASTIIPHIEASPNAKQGIVNHEATLEDIEDNDMVLCRNTYPLVRLCLKFLSEGRKAKIMGGEIGLSLIKMVEDTKRRSEDWTIENMFIRLYSELDKLCKVIMRTDGVNEGDAKETGKYSIAEERVSVLEMLSKTANTPDELIEGIKELFSDSKAGITLATIHKSKGLESERVFIIHPEKMPSKYAEKDWELVQEENLKYVAYTRAKDYLGFIDVSKFDAWEDATNENKTPVKQPKNTTSKWVGAAGQSMQLQLKIVMVKEISSSYGDTCLFEMEDKDGNMFSKFGKIKEKFITKGKDIEVGTEVAFIGVIKEHREYKGEKVTCLSRVS